MSTEPALRVCACAAPRMAVMVGRDLVEIWGADLTHDRADLVCVNDQGKIVILVGIPSQWPVIPTPPGHGWLPLATVRVRVCTSCIMPADIQEWHP